MSLGEPGLGAPGKRGGGPSPGYGAGSLGEPVREQLNAMVTWPLLQVKRKSESPLHPHTFRNSLSEAFTKSWFCLRYILSHRITRYLSWLNQ